jgi:hypothetical protein
MAQRTPTSPGNRGSKTSTPAKKAGASSTASGASRPPGKSSPAASARPTGPAPGAPRSAPQKRPSKSGRSIVHQKERPWGLIVTTVVIVLLAVGVIGYAVLHKPAAHFVAGSYTNPEIPDAKAISGLIYHQEPNHTHVEGNITYDTSPPTGGNHSQYWADCNGTVYPNAIANENAVHMLEHGAVWITYNPSLAADQVATLAKLVTASQSTGGRMAMSPYPGLKTAISLQAWDYQLFVNSASDPRIQQFILALRFNPKTTPEPSASCSQPSFIKHPSTFGHPLWVAATS